MSGTQYRKDGRSLKNEVSFRLHSKQYECFYVNPEARVKIIAKGRRFGFTRGLAIYNIERMLSGVTPIVWIDTTYSNVERYVERYFMPELHKLPRWSWRWKQSKHELWVGDSVIDFRSAEYPEAIEGFGYRLVNINEAGIVLKDRYLWLNAIQPMLFDYGAPAIIGGTPKGKTVRRTGEEHLFYELYKRAESGDRANWVAYNYSSYDNPLLSADDIREMELDTPPTVREQEIYGRFVSNEDTGIIKRDFWHEYDWTEESSLAGSETRQGFIIQSWDTAFKRGQENDYSVCTTWRVLDGQVRMIDCVIGRYEYPALIREAERMQAMYQPKYLLIEDAASGQSLLQSLREKGLRPIAIPPSKDKTWRAHEATKLMSVVEVAMPDANLPWKHKVIEQCADFPNVEHDDIVDSVTQTLVFLHNTLGIGRLRRSGSSKGRTERSTPKQVSTTREIFKGF
jgi:predicted phage terminase large subunit-like protein